MWTANELLRQHSTRFTFFLQPPPVYPIAVVADAGSLCPFLFGPRNIIYTVASIRILLYRLYCCCAQRDRKVLIPFLPLIFVCNFLIIIDDRLLFLSSNLLFDRLLVNEELKWAALLARSGNPRFIIRNCCHRKWLTISRFLNNELGCPEVMLSTSA